MEYDQLLPLTKKAKTTLKHDCKYQQEWQSHGIIASPRGPNYARCKSCSVDINISHGGLNDVKKHLATNKHQELSKATEMSGNLRELFRHSQSPIEEAVTRAEVLFAVFVAEHNLSFSTTNHFTHLTSAMFPDSKVAQAFQSARTKTTCIVKGALHPHFMQAVIDRCKNGPFSILCDEGNDAEDKNFAILVRYWDNHLAKPTTRLLDIPICNIGTAENLFSHIESALVKNEIPWSNVVGFESDTTNVMVGKHNSVLSRIVAKQPLVYSQGCVCHLANLCLLAGVKCLPVYVDDFFVDLFYYFDKSAKRKELKEFQEFTDTKKPKVLKHCKTRWLMACPFCVFLSNY